MQWYWFTRDIFFGFILRFTIEWGFLPRHRRFIGRPKLKKFYTFENLYWKKKRNSFHFWPTIIFSVSQSIINDCVTSHADKLFESRHYSQSVTCRSHHFTIISNLLWIIQKTTGRSIGEQLYWDIIEGVIVPMHPMQSSFAHVIQVVDSDFMHTVAPRQTALIHKSIVIHQTSNFYRNITLISEQ